MALSWLKVVDEITMIFIPGCVHLALLVYLEQNIEKLVITVAKILKCTILSRVASYRLQLAKKEFWNLVELFLLLFMWNWFTVLRVRHRDILLEKAVRLWLVFVNDLICLLCLFFVFGRIGARFYVVRNAGQKYLVELSDVFFISYLNLVSGVVDDCFQDGARFKVGFVAHSH